MIVQVVTIQGRTSIKRILVWRKAFRHYQGGNTWNYLQNQLDLDETSRNMEDLDNLLNLQPPLDAIQTINPIEGTF